MFHDVLSDILSSVGSKQRFPRIENFYTGLIAALPEPPLDGLCDTRRRSYRLGIQAGELLSKPLSFWIQRVPDA